MGDIYIDSPEQLEQALQYWKDYSIDGKYVKLDDVVKTIGTPDSPVEARQEFAARWVVSAVGLCLVACCA